MEAHPAMQTHAVFGGFILELGAEDHVPTHRGAGYLGDKWLLLKQYLIANPTAHTADDQLMWDVVVRKAPSLPYPAKKLVRALARDSFSIGEEGQIKRMMPVIADIPTAHDEVHALLDDLGLNVARRHLDLAIDLHARGEWEPANGELRKVLESIFDEAATGLAPERAAGKTSENRRQLLAQIDPPFFIEGLKEWTQDGKNLINGVIQRLNPGAHAGLSEDEDCTFRLHLVLVIARLFLRRLKARVSQE
jgi:hypothetical protein